MSTPKEKEEFTYDPLKGYSSNQDPDPQFNFNGGGLELTESQKADIDRQYRRVRAELAGKTLEQYDAEIAAEKQKYIDDPTLADREAAEMMAKFKAEMDAIDADFFKKYGVHLLGDE